jgi:hypothetical protein
VTNLHLEEIREFDIPLISSKEQDLILKCIQSITIFIKGIGYQKQKLLLQKQGLMQDLLSGKVRMM